MAFKIDEIFLSTGEDSSTNAPGEGLEDSIDVIVITDEGVVYVASLLTFEQVGRRWKRQGSTTTFSQKYLWIAQLILIEDFSFALVQAVVEDLIEEGNFLSAFRRLGQQWELGSGF